MIDIGQNYVVEFARKIPNATTITLDYLGYYNKASIKEDRNIDEKTYFGDTTTTDDYENILSKITGIKSSGSLSFYPVDLTKLNDMIIKSNDVLKEFFFGVLHKPTNKSKYTDKAVVNSFTLSIPETGFVECNCDLKFNKITSSTSDYAGQDINGITYSHGTLPTTKPLTSSDVNSASFDGIPLKISKVDFKIEYDIDEKTDLTTEETLFKVKMRNITIDGLELATESDDFINAIESETYGDFVLNIGSNTITVYDVLFPNTELNIESGSSGTQSFSSAKTGKITFT